jgi:hypothetical protein
MIIAEAEKEREAVTPAQFQEAYAKVREWWTRNEDAGLIVRERGHRLQGARTARTVRINGSAPVVTDGPFAETKETVGGYGIIEAPDMDAAVALVRSWPGLPVAIEVRPILEM